MKQGDGARRPVSSCPCGGYLVAPSHLIPSRSSSRSLVSSGVSSRSHQMRASKQDGKGVSSRSRRPVPSSVRRAGRPRGSRGVPGGVVVSSSSHPRQASKRREDGSASWRGRGSFSFKQRRSGGACGPPIGWHCLVPSGGDDTGGGVVLSSFPRRSPVRAPSPHQFPYRKNPASKQAMGMAGRFRRSYPGGGGNGGQASKTRTTNNLTPFPIIPRPHDTTRFLISYPINAISPLTRQAHNETQERDARTRERGRTRKRERGRARERRANDEHGNTRPRKTTSKQRDARRDDKRDTRQQDGGRDEAKTARGKNQAWETRT